MAENSNIAWTDHTFNPWIGCDEVSAACDFCYARELSEQYGWAKWGAKEPRHRTAISTWKNLRKWDRQSEKSGVSLKVFFSLGDPFDNKVPEDWRDDYFDEIDATPHLIHQLLTKRPQNIIKFTPEHWRERWPRNVWIGCTAENQDEYFKRRRPLFGVPAAVHFISYEPALGPLEIRGQVVPDWIICGGESGPNRRPFNMQWAEDLREQCAETGTAFFFKQDAALKPGQRGRASDALWACKQFPK